VGVGVGGPTSNLHVVGDALITGNVSDLNVVSNVNMLHTANTASIKLNSNVVAEFPRSKKVIKYPRVAMTSDNQPTGYVSSASTVEGTNYAWRVFDMINPEGGSGNRWRSGNYVYTNNSAGSPAIVGTAAQLSASSGTPSGEYILVTLPEKMCLKRYSWSGMTTQSPGEGEIWGSNDGSSWSHVHTFADGGAGWIAAGSSTSDYGDYPDYRDVGEGNVAFYSRYAFIITKLVAGDVAASMRKLEYYGILEYDPEAHGTDVTVKSYPNVPNTDWLEVYYDAKGLSNGAVTDPISGLGGTTINGTATNVTVSDGAFVFDGSSSYINGGTTPISGNHHHSFSCWLKPTSGNTNYRGIGYIIHTINVNNATTGLFLRNMKPVMVTWGSNLEPDYTLPEDEWVHVTAVYYGTGRKIYVNSKPIGSDTYSSYNINASANLYIGASTGDSGASVAEIYNGSIANFRLFNRALTSDEIYQLYAYQKEYFGLGDLSMTLKAGRLGIGTSEPLAMLDVRGDVHISGSLRKTRALMFRRNSGSYTYTTQNTFQTVVDYGPPWVAYSTNPLYNISHTGDYTDTNNHHMYLRIAIKNGSTGEVVYFPDSTGWRYYLHTTYQRLDEHSYQGIFSGLTIGNSYTTSYQIKPAGVSSYTWNSIYGDITGIVWD
jgi:hypothetical protein